MRTKVFLLSPLAWACVAAMAQSLPTGGVIVQGAGKVSTTGNAMVIDQSTNRMVADWQSFSIGAGNSVRFNQPSSSSVALNRVVGGDPSQIFGSLSANGHVYLQNPNGVLFAPGARIDVGSFVATTLNTDVGEFMAGRLRLAGSSGAAVVNDGQITTTQGGHVVLAAAQVANHGSISTPGGTTALVAAGAVNVDPTGSGLLTISVPVAAVGASLAHRGTITADGGAVQLVAAAEDAARRTVMQVDGVVRARSIEQRDGQILLSGGASGIVEVGGTLDASGGAGRHGGTVKVLGDRIGLLGSATIDASGGSGGGTVLVGGNFQGRGPEQNAQVVVVGPQATIDVSARDQGDGGRSIVWSDRQTSFQGHVAARGGAYGGDGGFAEVSGKEHLDFAGTSDLLAPAGHRGTLLLDPSTLIIGAVADINGDVTQGDDLVASPLLATDFPAANAPSQITAARVATLLGGGDVLLQSTLQLSVTAPLTVAPGGAASTLTLNSPAITIGAAMTLNNSALVADTAQNFSDSIRINAPVSSLRSVALTSSDIGINALVTTPALTLSGSGSFSVVNEGANGGIDSAAVSALNLVEGASDLTLRSLNNHIGSLTLQVRNATVQNNNPAGTPMNLQGNVSGALDVSATGGLAQTAALSVVGTTQITTTDTSPVVLTNPANFFGAELSFAAGGDFSLASTGLLFIDGRGAGDVRVTVADSGGGGRLSLGTPGINTTGALIDLTSVGFVDNSDTGAALQTGAGGRFIIRSSDFLSDTLGSVTLGAGANQINNVLLGGWTGAFPATGNVYVTNRTGTITTPPGDVANVNRVYDGSTAFAYTLTGTAADAALDNGEGTTAVPLFAYTVNSTGAFANKNAGTDKAYTVAASNDVVGTGSAGEQYWGLAFAGTSRASGVGAPGISTVTARPVTSTGIVAVDRVYDGTTVVTLNTGAAALGNTVAGDAIVLNTAGATGSIADKSAGTARPVTIAGLALGGADAVNYTLVDANNAAVNITPRGLTLTGITATDRTANGTTSVQIDTANAAVTGVLAGDVVVLDTAGAAGSVQTPDPGTKPVFVTGATLGGADGGNYTILATPITSSGQGLTVRILAIGREEFEAMRYKQYLEGVSDAQEPFRRAMAEALAAGFGKENIRKQLTRGLVFETGLAAPAVDNIETAARPVSCTAGAGLACAK
jgi:filamentous hemagglutinin family protein